MNELDWSKEIWSAPNFHPKVLVIGTFDIPHYGHFRFLKEAAKLGKVIVALGTDEHQVSWKRQPVLTYLERKATLEELPWVTAVVKRDKPSCREIVNAILPKYIPYGSDWTLKDFLSINELRDEYIDRHGITMVRIVRDGGMSSSKIIQRIEDRKTPR
jgi:D-beta-D-heptose 7-phosphate kinase/D-beta-D-heptose 1-phosphate adenosyltransferase